MRRLAALLAALGCAAPVSALELTVFHTNDVHGFIMARPAKQAASLDAGDTGDLIGGSAVLGAYLKTQKGPRLLLDAGDWAQGTPEGTTSKGALTMDIMSALGYDAAEVGNHDFDWGLDNLKSVVARAKMPILGANVYDEKAGRRAGFLTPWIVKEVAGVKVGIFGLLTTEMPHLEVHANYAGLSFRDEAAEARDAVKALQEQGATVIIAVTHVGFREKEMAPFFDDKALAAAVPGIDLIVGGHTHTYLKEPYRDPKNGTLVVQAGHALTRVGRVTLDIDDQTKKVVSSSGRLVSLWLDRYGQDPAIEKISDAYEPAIHQVYDVAFATAAETLRRDRDHEAPLGDWMADCLRAWGGTDIGLQSYIPADMPAGPVTLRSMLGIMPFDNRMVKLTMKGRLIKEVFDHGVARTKMIISVSGAGYTYDRDKPAGQRVLKAEVGGRPLDPNRSYTVSTVDFIVNGGDGYTPFAKAEKTDFSTDMVRDVLAACARRQGTVTAPAGGRLTSVEGGAPR